MKQADNTELNDLVLAAQSSDAALMNSAAPAVTGTMIATDPDQIMPSREVEQGDLTIGFFAVGAVINIVMITAYFIWAYKQLKKTGSNKALAEDE